MADRPPIQLSIDALNSTTPNLADLADIAQCTYTHGRLTPLLQSNIDALHTATPNLVDIVQCSYIHGRLIPSPPPIEHRCLEYCYTKLGRYSTMHIYPWQIDATTSSNCA